MRPNMGLRDISLEHYVHEERQEWNPLGTIFKRGDFSFQCSALASDMWLFATSAQSRDLIVNIMKRCVCDLSGGSLNAREAPVGASATAGRSGSGLHIDISPRASLRNMRESLGDSRAAERLVPFDLPLQGAAWRGGDGLTRCKPCTKAFSHFWHGDADTPLVVGGAEGEDYAACNDATDPELVPLKW